MMNRSVPSAIESMKYAASRPNVPSDVWYYLGEAYMKNYQFPEARKAYIQFSDIATKAENKEMNPLRKAEMASNAMELSRNYNSIDIIASSLFSFSSNYVRQIKAAGGTLDVKPLQFTSSYESAGDLAGYCFSPNKLVKGHYLYFSGYGRLKKWGKDIYRVKVIGQKKFSEPEQLKSVNSDFNEILPYYDPVGEDLYFASDGYNSMGGYDIFKSHYKRDNDTWSEPINLGFPINSPDNEYIFIPGTDLGKAMLLTDRQGLDTMLTIYLLHIKEPKKSSLITDNEELKRIGKFGGIESIPEIVNITETGFPSEVSVVSVKPAEVRPIIRQDINHSDEYKMTVRKALDFQFKSDSLTGLAKEARINVKAIPEPDKRWTIQSRIISWEKQSSECQSKANEYYAQLRKLENGKKAEDQLPAIEKDTVINAMTVYRFNTPQSIKNSDDKPTSKSSPNVKTAGEAVKEPKKPAVSPVRKSEVANHFIILEKSPYSSVNPFPVDIDIPAGAFYRIQLGVFSQKQDMDAFGGLSPITTETITGKALTRYYAGKFTNYESARSALNIVRNKGYKDAFIVAWYNGQKLSPDKVLEFERRDNRQ